MFNENYNIRLNNFEGPMDLLLYFINRDRIDIYDIPILKITKEYLEYIKTMDLMDINLGAEFIQMTSLLLQIKARMLLPKETIEEGGEIEDPRAELVLRLLDYKRFKEASEDLQSKFDNHSKRHSKGMLMEYRSSKDLSLFVPEDIKLFDLISSFKRIIENLPENNELDFFAEHINLQDQIDFIREILIQKKQFLLTSLILENSSKIYLIGIFLAILELIHINEITCNQTKNFSNIKIMRL